MSRLILGWKCSYSCQSSIKKLLAVLDKLFMSFVKASFWSIVILRSFTPLVPLIRLFSIINVMLLLVADGPRKIIWNLRGLATIL